MFKIPAQNTIWEIDQPQVMGILNITQDSFFAQSRTPSIPLAVEMASKFILEGAHIIDIGGQSTRPGARFISPEQEIQQVIPIIEAIRAKHPQVLLSIDTFHSKVATSALIAGVNIVNDISCGSFDENMFKTIATYNAGYIGMHLTGNFESMHEVPTRKDVMNDLLEYFDNKSTLLAKHGIHHWVIDPGFGFGKTIQENFTIVKNLSALKKLGLPILLGVSRKSSIYKTLHCTPEKALNGTTIVNTVGLQNGANIIRVHDVVEAKEAIELLKYLS